MLLSSCSKSANALGVMRMRPDAVRTGSGGGLQTNHKQNGVNVVCPGFEAWLAPGGAGMQNISQIMLFGGILKKAERCYLQFTGRTGDGGLSFGTFLARFGLPANDIHTCNGGKHFFIPDSRRVLHPAPASRGCWARRCWDANHISNHDFWRGFEKLKTARCYTV